VSHKTDCQIIVKKAGSYLLSHFGKAVTQTTKNRGSTCNGLPLSFSSNTSLVESVMSIGKGTDSDNLAWWGQSVSLLSPQVRTIRLLGATGIELCYLASGKIDLYLNYGSKPYDYAPGSLIAKEAGANVCNFDQKSWSIKNSDIIVGNKKIINESIILLKGK